MIAIAPLTTRAAWKAFDAHYQKIRAWHLRTLFADDATQGERMAVEAVGIYFDYSKHRITDETLTLLWHLSEESGLRSRIEAMFRGDNINVTKKRAVLYVAMRAPKGHSIVVDGEDVVPQVHAVLDKMADFSNGCVRESGQGNTLIRRYRIHGMTSMTTTISQNSRHLRGNKNGRVIHYEAQPHQPKAPEAKPGSKPDPKDDLKSLALAEVEKKLALSPDGLSQAEAQKRLTQYGPNQTEEAPSVPAIPHLC